MMKIIQTIISILLFLCVIAEVIAHFKSISGFGWLLVATFLVLTWSFVKQSISEYRNPRNK